MALLVSGFGPSDPSVTREQDPLTVNLNTIVLKLENSRVRVLEATIKPVDQTNSEPVSIERRSSGWKTKVGGLYYSLAGG